MAAWQGRGWRRGDDFPSVWRRAVGDAHGHGVSQRFRSVFVMDWLPRPLPDPPMASRLLTLPLVVLDAFVVVGEAAFDHGYLGGVNGEGGGDLGLTFAVWLREHGAKSATAVGS